MDEGGHENGRHRMEFYNGHTQWNMNMIPQYQIKDHNNVLYMNKRIMHIAAERDAAIEERDRALSERKAAMEERDAVIQQCDRAIAERDNAIKERDNAIAALRFQENPTNNALNFGVQRGSQRMHPITDACPIQAISAEAVKIHQEKRKKQNKSVSSKPPSKKVKRKISEDLNRRVTTDGSKAEWDSMDLGMMNQISFDKTTMPIPVCSCTGVQRACYKWGNGGWQSSCCTTTLSMYPLPQMPNKRHSRMGGRKMSGSVFTRLLTRVAAQGHDLRMPLDLKGYWAKHGTNRYITIQ